MEPVSSPIAYGARTPDEKKMTPHSALPTCHDGFSNNKDFANAEECKARVKESSRERTQGPNSEALRRRTGAH